MTALTPERTARLFQRLSQDQDFVAWLEDSKAKAIDGLTKAVEPHAMFRYQGRATLIGDIEKQIEHARKA